MNTDAPHDGGDLKQQIEAYLDGVASEAEVARLNELLATRPEIVAAFAEAAQFDYLLETFWQDEHESQQANAVLERLRLSDPASAAADIVPRTQSRESAPKALHSSSSRLTGWRGPIAEFAREPLAMAILLLVMISGAVLYWRLSQPAPQPIATQQPVSPDVPPQDIQRGNGDSRAAQIQTQFVARLTRSVNAAWDLREPPADGAQLRLGQQLALRSGLAEIAFDTGATVILEGPAELELGSPRKEGAEKSAGNSCALRIGKLVARVQGQARGFTVDTPTMTIEDLGTEFAVSVTSVNNPPRDALPVPPSVSTEVHVLRGVVKVTPQPAARAPVGETPVADPESQILRTGQAVSNPPVGAATQIARAQPEIFVRELPVKAPAAKRTSPLKAGDILAVCRNSLKLVKIDPQTGVQTLMAQGDPALHGPEWMCVAVDAAHQVYVGTEVNHAAGGGQVLRIDPRDGSIAVVAGGVQMAQSRFNALVVTGDGTLLAAQDGPRDRVLSIEPRTGKMASVVDCGDNLWSIALDGDRRQFFIVSDGGPAGLARYAEGKLTPWLLYEDPRNYRSVAVGTDGRVFVSYVFDEARTIVEVDRRTHGLRPVVNLPGARAPLGQMAVEADGCLIVGSYGLQGVVFRVDVANKAAKRLAENGHLERSGGVAVVPGFVLAAGAEKGLP